MTSEGARFRFSLTVIAVMTTNLRLLRFTFPVYKLRIFYSLQELLQECNKAACVTFPQKSMHLGEIAYGSCSDVAMGTSH